jgi:hypothetical protein
VANPVESLDFQVNVSGADQAASDIARAEESVDGLNDELRRARAAGNQASGAYSKAQRAANGLGKATKGADQAVKAKRRSVALATNEVTEFLGPMGQAVGISGQFSTAMQSAGNTAFQLGITMGPVGIAIGLVVGLLPEIIRLYNDWTGSSDDAADAQKRLQENTAAVNKSLREQTTEAKAVTAALAALATGQRIAELERRRAGLEQDFFESDEDFARRKRQIDIAIEGLKGRLAQEQALYQALRNRVEAEREAASVSSASSGGGGGRAQRGPSEAEQLDSLMRAALGPNEVSELGSDILSFAERSFDLEEQARRAERERIDALKEKKEIQAQLAADAQRAAEAERERLETARQAVQAAKAQAEQSAQIALINQGAALAVDSVSTGIQAAIQGEESFLQAFAETIRARLNGLAIEYTAKSLAALGQGLLTKDPGAFAAAKVYGTAAATAASLAGVSAAAAGGGGGGGVGGGAGGNDVNVGATDRNDAPAGGGSQPETIIINLNAPVPEALQGRQIEQARRAADRRFGSRG